MFDQLRERFRRECAALHALQHEAIPHIYGNESHEGHPFLVMECATGTTMGQAFPALLSQGGWGAVFKMARQVASALDAVHGHGIVHRDIKPSNIVLDSETAKAVVLDFGIAHTSDTQLTAEGVRIGTPGFSAPEQVMGAPVPASDQWSLAACFYAMLTNLRPGELPGEQEAAANGRQLAFAVDERIVSNEVLPFGDAVKLVKLVDVPGVVVAAVAKAMAYEPEDRFPSVTAFVEAMELGIVDHGAPVHVDSPTKGLPSQAGDGEDLREVVTPRARPVAPIGATTASHDAIAVAAYATSEATRRSPLRRRYLPFAAVLALVLGVGSYLLWGRGGQSPVAGSTDSPMRAIETIAPVPAEAGAVAVAGPTEVEVQVVALYNGKRVERLQLRIGDETKASPFRAFLPIGETLVHVDSSDYLGTYSCPVAEGTDECTVNLVAAQAAAAKKQSRRGKRESKAGTPSLLNRPGEGAQMGTFYNQDGPKRDSK